MLSLLPDGHTIDDEESELILQEMLAEAERRYQDNPVMAGAAILAMLLAAVACLAWALIAVAGSGAW